ncbi:hypothetical protein [Bordetella sp. N]|uniref:hypothetical protein n=1 Tax=Bordetella sp. N TaxID=1746199 RepID=UPI00070A26F6|nr:hypothetical protein [Bordetella sp. N]ALM84695.1 hypothetical protein ASB57_18455 [Bordetella sp. N]
MALASNKNGGAAAQAAALASPLYMPGYENGQDAITDETIRAYAAVGIPWAIAPVSGLVAGSGSTFINMYASPEPLQSLDDLHRADVKRIAYIAASADNFTYPSSPVALSAFMTNGTLYVHYTVTDSSISAKASGLSTAAVVVVDRSNPGAPDVIDPRLVPLELSQYSYGVRDVAANRVMRATFFFDAPLTLKARDVITVYMGLKGAATSNLGQTQSRQLLPYTLSASDISSGAPIVFPSLQTGLDNGFNAARLNNIEASDGLVYYTVTDGSNGRVTRSASRSVTVDTVTPHS